MYEPPAINLSTLPRADELEIVLKEEIRKLPEDGKLTVFLGEALDIRKSEGNEGNAVRWVKAELFLRLTWLT